MSWTVVGSESHWMYKQPLINCDMPGNIPQLTSVCFIVSFYCLGEAGGGKPGRQRWYGNAITHGLVAFTVGTQLYKIWNDCWKVGWYLKLLGLSLEKGGGGTRTWSAATGLSVLLLLQYWSFLCIKLHCISHGASASKSGSIRCRTEREPSVFSPRPS